MLDVPCLTIRPNTERPITISHGTNQLVEPDAVAARVRSILAGNREFPTQRPPVVGRARWGARGREHRTMGRSSDTVTNGPRVALGFCDGRTGAPVHRGSAEAETVESGGGAGRRRTASHGHRSHREEQV